MNRRKFLKGSITAPIAMNLPALPIIAAPVVAETVTLLPLNTLSLEESLAMPAIQRIMWYQGFEIFGVEP